MNQLEIPGRIAVTAGNGGLRKVNVTTPFSTAEIYLHGAHVTGFQKNGGPPLIFLSAKSHFAPGKAIRGGVPVILPWFGNRDGEPSHGFARNTEWELVKTSEKSDGSVRLHFNLPENIFEKNGWPPAEVDFTVTVHEKLTMELTVTNRLRENFTFENCLHTYFHVGDIGAVSVTGLQGASYVDNAGDGHGALKTDGEAVLRISRETNRLYQDTTGLVEIRDESLKRIIRVEKSGSHSTVVWNPWTTQKLPDDFDPAEHKHMVCVESGNIKRNKISLAPGKTSALKVVLSSAPLK